MSLTKIVSLCQQIEKVASKTEWNNIGSLNREIFIQRAKNIKRQIDQEVTRHQRGIEDVLREHALWPERKNGMYLPFSIERLRIEMEGIGLPHGKAGHFVHHEESPKDAVDAPPEVKDIYGSAMQIKMKAQFLLCPRRETK